MLEDAKVYQSNPNHSEPTISLIESTSQLPVDSQIDHHEETLSREIKQNMVLEMIKCSLMASRVDDHLKAEEVYQVLD